MPRLTHKTTDGLTEEATRLMRAGFHGKKTYAAIVRDLAEIGVSVPERTIARRGHEWAENCRRRQAARDYVSDLVAAAAENPEASQVLGALATDALIEDPDGFAKADPIKVQRLNLRSEELRLKREEMEIRKRQIAAEETRLRMLEAREQRAIRATDELKAKQERGESLTPEDIDRIREVYGLNR